MELPDRKSKHAKLTILGKGSVFGDEDCINKSPYSSTLVCSINHSKAFVINKTDFERIYIGKLMGVLGEV